MSENKQLVRKNNGGGYNNVYPYSFTETVKDKKTGKSLEEILAGTNFLYLPYRGSKAATRLQVDERYRRKGLWIQYVTNLGSVVVEYYNSDDVSDTKWADDKYWAPYNSAQFNPGTVGLDALSQEAKDYLLTNSPINTEDITRDSQSRLQLADRAYNPASFSGKGYKILRPNILNDTNVLAQSMILDANTVYEIRYDFDLNEQEINIPNGSVLIFNGGSFNNGVLILNKTHVTSNIDKFIFKNITFKNITSNSINNDYIESKWFNLDTNGEEDCSTILNIIANLCTTAVKPLNLNYGTYLIEDTVVFNNGSWNFRGIIGNKSIIKTINLTDKPVISVQNGSGNVARAIISDIQFIGNNNAIAIELKGCCQVYIKYCQFYSWKYAINLSNDVGVGTFTEGCIVYNSRFSGSTCLRYFKGKGDMSFHGSGMKDCWLDVPLECNAVLIEDGAMPYNSPLDFRSLCPVNTTMINNKNTSSSVIANFFGNINVESNDFKLADGASVFFEGNINILGRYVYGSLQWCEKIEVRGPNFSNYVATVPKTLMHKITLNNGEFITLSSTYSTIISIPENLCYFELKSTRSLYGGNAQISTPIIGKNLSWVKNNIQFTEIDGGIKLTYIGDSATTLIYSTTYNSPDNYSSLLNNN